MDKLINYYFNLISTKNLQENIATDLRDITSVWNIKYEEEVEEEVNKVETAKESDILTNDDIDFYKQIDEILARANQSISKDLTKATAAKKNTLIEPPKLTSTVNNQNFKKCKSSFTLTKPKPGMQQPPPTYLKAPYKTTTIKQPVIKSSINQLNKKSLSIDNLSIKKSDIEQIRGQTSITAEISIKKTIEKKLITKYKPVSFKEMAMNLYLSPKLEYLTVKSTELALKLNNKKRKSIAKQSFLNKLNKNFCNNNNIEQTNPYRIEIIYKKTKDLLLTQVYQLDTNPKLIYHLKLKLLIAYFESFNEKIKQQIPKEMLSYSNRVDEQIQSDLNLDLFVSNFNNSSLPIQYENDAQLIRLNDLKCDLFELEFKILLYNYLKTSVLNISKSKDSSYEKNIEFLKLVYSFISDDNKKVIIAS